jgi:hypothetical protein
MGERMVPRGVGFFAKGFIADPTGCLRRRRKEPHRGECRVRVGVEEWGGEGSRDGDRRPTGWGFMAPVAVSGCST